MRVQSILSRSGRVVGAIGLTGLLALSAVAPSGASTKHLEAGLSPFCTTLTTQKITTVSPGNTPAYKAYVKAGVAYYGKLAAEAPNGSVKSALQGLIAILKTEECASTATKLATAIAHDSKQFAQDLAAFIKASLSCVLSLP